MTKRILISAFISLACLPLFSQGKVSTRKYILSDFPDKITQVVLTENEVLNSALQQEIPILWSASAYEFCSPETFEQLKTRDQYYFLLPAQSRFKNEETPGILFLTLVKGCPEAAEGGIAAMTEVISLPLAAAMGGSGRELIYLGALIQAVQEFTLAAMESEKVAYGMDAWFNANFSKYGKMKHIYLSQDDLAPACTEKAIGRYRDSDMHIVTEAEADQVYLSGTYNALVSYTVSPVIPELDASYSYQLLFEAQTHTLYYIQKHLISGKAGAGFLPEDFKRMAKKR